VLSKIFHDLKSLPAVRDLLTYMTSICLGGNFKGNGPLAISARLSYNALNFVIHAMTFRESL